MLLITNCTIRRIGAAGIYPTGDGKKVSASGTTTTTTEIVVLSHAPVVNPLPRTPLDQREPKTRRARAPEKNIAEGFDSDSQSPKQSDSEEAPKPRKQGRPRKNPLPPAKPAAVPTRPATSRRAKGKVVYQEEEEDDDEEEDMDQSEEQEEKKDQPVKKPPKQQKPQARSKPQATKSSVKQTKIDDFSPKGRGAGKTLNGASSAKSLAVVNTKTAAKIASGGRGAASQGPAVKRFVTSPPAVSPNRSKIQGGESDDSSKGGDDRRSPAVVRRLKPPMLRENMLTRPSPTKSPGFRKRSPPSSPSSASTSPSHVKKARLALSESGSERSRSPPAPAKRGPVARPEPIKSNIRNTKRGVVSNGTSDGEDAPETSQSSLSVSQSKASSAQSQEDDEGLSVRISTIFAIHLFFPLQQILFSFPVTSITLTKLLFDLAVIPNCLYTRMYRK
ncbi:hypothetical protein PoB_004099000 [Plakobranchus ocellatus]|uniref:Uncharacterized protein n=1 Tax=Plakobranchus ocellatus TaxID=259542 RepID=A0AAV4B1L9_9GAST|nr:hypothetical protein PoB_004099000 [Plakobranchus ocellatus]